MNRTAHNMGNKHNAKLKTFAKRVHIKPLFGVCTHVCKHESGIGQNSLESEKSKNMPHHIARFYKLQYSRQDSISTNRANEQESRKSH